MDLSVFHSIWTVALFVLFIGIWAWAWSSKRKPGFDAAARLPLEDEVHGRTNAAEGSMPGAADDKTLTTRRGEHNNG